MGRFQEGTGFRDAIGLEGGSKVEWVLTGSGFPRFADQFRELVPGFARFRGSESGNFVRGGIVKPPGCWGYCLRLLVLEVHGLQILQVATAKRTSNWAKSCAAPWTLLVTWTGLPHGKTYWNPPSAEQYWKSNYLANLLNNHWLKRALKDNAHRRFSDPNGLLH